MSIRYYATNRNREDLGRDLPRDKRIQLQQGGYHWIDTNRYLSYYLATTDTEKMPSEVLVKDSGQEIFSKFLGLPSIKRIVIGIHGFNVPLHGAINSFSMLTDTLRYTKTLGPTLITNPGAQGVGERLQNPSENLTAFVGFSWPSEAKLTGYASDQAEAIASGPALANLITRIRVKNPTAKVNIIAHSMGNFLTCNMLKGLVHKEIVPFQANQQVLDAIERAEKERFIDRYIMLAADVERRHVTQCDIDESSDGKAEYLGPYYPGLKYLVGQVHSFYSRFDTALLASNVEKKGRKILTEIKEVFTEENLDHRWEERLGRTVAPALAPPNLYSHNAVTLTNREIDHGDYFDAKIVADMIERIILSD